MTEITNSKTPSLAVYIHWPWCENKCPYCDFNSHVNNNYPEQEYVNTLLKHIDFYAEKLGKRPVKSIFFGGGTPSLMQPQSINQIVKHIGKAFDLDESTAEISMEANPASSNLEKFRDFKSAGINRLSIGVQSFHDQHLKFLGRWHDQAQALQTIEDAKSIFENVSTDLIYGLPNQKLDEWQDDLQRILDYDLNHLSCYQLTIEKQTAFYKQVNSGEWEPIDSDKQADFFDYTRETIVSQNRQNYEISNFAKPNFECKHNVHVWQYQDYIGIGAGAHGRFQPHDSQYFLSQNIKLPDKYMHNINMLKKFNYILDTIPPEQELGERLLMGLRLQQGIDIENINNNLFYNENLSNNWPEMDKMIRLGFIQKTDKTIQITPQGWPILDSITSVLLNSIQKA